tara:strand:+ start:1409 stop:2344 length:936 start_codon:yes stop_codon:yes gene_type:complete
MQLIAIYLINHLRLSSKTLHYFITFTLLLIGSISFAQNHPDLVVLKSNDSIKCSITSIEMNHFEVKTIISNQERTVTIQRSDIQFYQKNYYSDSFKYNQPNPIEKPPKELYHFRLGFTGGWGYRLASITSGLDPAIEDHYKRLKSGYFFQVQGEFFINENIGIGGIYVFNEATSSIDNVSLIFTQQNLRFVGTLRERVTIQSYGPMLSIRSPFLSEFSTINAHIGLTYNDYENQITDITDIKITGNSVGAYVGVDFDFELQPHIILTAHASTNLSNVNRLSYTGPDSTYTITGYPESLNRLDLGIGIHFGF